MLCYHSPRERAYAEQPPLIAMTDNARLREPVESSDEPVFAALITPHRSLGPSALRLVITLVCIASIISSLPFVLMGAWPVAGFFGLDLLAFYIALRINARRAEGFEQIMISRVMLLLRKVSHHGRQREWQLNPRWTKLERKTHAEFGVEQLALVSRGQRVVMGADLSPEEKASLGDAVSEALARVKHQA